MPKPTWMLLTLLLAPAAQAGLLADHWVPAGDQCPSDLASFDAEVAEAVRSCRDAASWTDDIGTRREDPRAFQTCMGDAGWTRTRRVRRASWLATCTEPEPEPFSDDAIDIVRSTPVRPPSPAAVVK
jgi:hypothetical protein